MAQRALKVREEVAAWISTEVNRRDLTISEYLARISAMPGDAPSSSSPSGRNGQYKFVCDVLLVVLENAGGKLPTAEAQQATVEAIKRSSPRHWQRPTDRSNCPTVAHRVVAWRRNAAVGRASEFVTNDLAFIGIQVPFPMLVRGLSQAQ